MLVSVIIPVYNVEAYLEQCVRSVLNQTYHDIEVILVDDGSSDDCPAMCDAFAKQDKRVKVIHKPNGGLSDARNTGTAIATGEYILFVDSDDFWTNEDDLERLVRVANDSPECDFIGFNSSYYYEVSNKVAPWRKYDEKIVEPIQAINCVEILVASGTFPMSACMKLIKREHIQGRIEFVKGIYSEDIPWFIELLKKSNKCRFINQYMYMYRKGRASSISGSFSYKKYNDICKLLIDGVEINARECNGRTCDAIYSFWAYELCILRAMTGFMDKKLRKKELIELYKYDWLFDYQLHPKVKTVVFVQKCFGKTITNYILYKYLRTRLA